MNREQALQLIEHLTRVEASEDREVTLENIYEIAHISICECQNPHNDWKEKWAAIYKSLKKSKQL